MSQEKEVPATQPAKQPYVKPEFRYEKVFVTTALSCGKISSLGQCQTAASSS
jgi:hypothetical protein